MEHNHNWMVIGTDGVDCPRDYVLMVMCECGLVGSIEPRSKEDIDKAFRARYHPFPWTGSTDIEIHEFLKAEIRPNSHCWVISRKDNK
jgi:hypothetical protein